MILTAPPDQKLKAAVLRRCSPYEMTAQLPIPREASAMIISKAPNTVSTHMRSFLTDKHTHVHLFTITESFLSSVTPGILV